MDLKNNKITVGELMANPAAKAVLEREFSQYMTPMLMQMAKNMTIKDVLKYASGRVPQQYIDKIIRELEMV